MQQWHDHLGHISPQRIIQMENQVDGIHILKGNREFLCEVCNLGKACTKAISSGLAVRSDVLFECVHSDICGPMSVPSIGGNLYFVTFIKDSGRYCWLYFLKAKSNLAGVLEDFIVYIKVQFGTNIKILHSDCGGEYTRSEAKHVLAKCGMVHELTAANTHQHIGVAKRKNLTLTNITRCMLIQSNLSSFFWPEAILYANTITNNAI